MDDDAVDKIDQRIEEIQTVIKKNGAHDSCYWTNLIESKKKGKAGLGLKIHGLK